MRRRANPLSRVLRRLACVRIHDLPNGDSNQDWYGVFEEQTVARQGLASFCHGCGCHLVVWRPASLLERGERQAGTQCIPRSHLSRTYGRFVDWMKGVVQISKYRFQPDLSGGRYSGVAQCRLVGATLSSQKIGFNFI